MYKGPLYPLLTNSNSVALSAIKRVNISKRPVLDFGFAEAEIFSGRSKFSIISAIYTQPFSRTAPFDKSISCIESLEILFLTLFLEPGKNEDLTLQAFLPRRKSRLAGCIWSFINFSEAFIIFALNNSAISVSDKIPVLNNLSDMDHPQNYLLMLLIQIMN